MARHSYWHNKTISRRSALRAAGIGAAGVAALSLAGCGNDQDKNAQSGPAVTDSTKGVHGGVARFMMSGPIAIGGRPSEVPSGYSLNGFVYDALLGHKWGQDSVPANDGFQLEPAVAQAMPEQPDPLTYVYKLRPGVKFHNGAVLTSEDVAYTIEAWGVNPRATTRAKWQNWLDRVETPSADLVTIKTKFPFADALLAQAGSMDGWIFNKAFEETPEAELKRIGTGPFMMSEIQEPLRVVFKKNPDYFLKPYPYFDAVEAYGSADVAKRTADFVSGQVHMPWWVGTEERDQIKQQRPGARLQSELLRAPSLFMRSDMAPFNDKRVRQALSMAIDRNKINQAATKGEGRPDQFFNVMYKEQLGTREVKDLPQAKYWDYNPTEAKRLLAAAGIDKPIESQISHWPATVNGQWFVDIATLTIAQWRELGIANVRDNEQVTATYQSTTARGQYEGLGLQINTGFSNSAPSYGVTAKDKFYWGPNGEHSPLNNSYANDAQLSALSEKQLAQLKVEDRNAIFREMEPLVAEQMYIIPYMTTDINWFFDPSLRNAVMPADQAARRHSMRWWFG